MYESLLLSPEDVTTLRACLRDPRFSPLLNEVPGLRVALQQPQPEFDEGNLLDLDYALEVVRGNTNYPEDWIGLRDVLRDALKRRRIFDEAVQVPQVDNSATDVLVAEPNLVAVAPVALAPKHRFVVVIESIGSADGPQFGSHVYDNFAQACAALHAEIKKSVDANGWSYREVQKGEPDPGMDEDDYGLNGYICGNPEEQSYWVYLGSRWECPNYCYSLQKFTNATADSRATAHAGGAE